jgi:hypothetical protein
MSGNSKLSPCIDSIATADSADPVVGPCVCLSVRLSVFYSLCRNVDNESFPQTLYIFLLAYLA